MPVPANTLAHYLQHLAQVMRADPRTDAELLTRFVDSRDEVAFTALVGRYAALVWENCRRVLGATPDAEDAFQATFLALAKQARSVRGETLPSWLYRVSRRVALSCRKSMLRRLRRETCAATASPTPTASVPAEDATAVWEELANLPERLRVPVTLYYLDGKTQAEAGRVLGVSDRAVAQRLEQALTTLRKRLTSRGFVAAAAALGTILNRASAAPVLPDEFLRRVASATAGGRVSPSVAELAARAVAPRPTLWIVAAVMLCGGVCGAALVLFAGTRNPPQPVLPPPEPVAEARPALNPFAPRRAFPAPWVTLTGKVTDDAGRPVPKVRLAVLGRTWNQKGSGLRDEIIADSATDASGQFRFPVERPVPGGRDVVWLTASAPGTRNVIEVPVAVGITPAEIAVRLAPGRVAGRVFGPNGEAVAGATVRVIRFGGAAFEPSRPDHLPLPAHVWPQPVATGPDGAFEFSEIDPFAEVWLAVSHPHTGAVSFPKLSRGQTNRNAIEVQMPHARRFSGRVLAADTGRPLSDAQVVIDFQSVPGGTPLVRSVRTDANGRFSLGVPVAPRWSVMVNSVPPPYVHCRRAVELPEGDGEVTQDFVLERGLVTHGLVTDDSGKPIRLAKICFYPAVPAPANADVPTMTPATTTDANGRFSLAVSAVGGVLTATAPDRDYVLTDVNPAATQGRPCAAHAAVTIAPGREPNEVALRLERGRTIQGRAVLPDGAPVPGGTVWCQCLIGGRDQQTPFALTIQDGRFAIPGCRPGRTYTIVLADRTFRHGAVARLAWSEQVADVALKPTGAVTVEVRNGADRVVPGAVTVVELGLPADEGTGEEPPATRWFPLASGGAVGPDGQRHLPGLVPGARYRIGASAVRGAGTTETIVTIPSGAHQQTTLVLPERAKE